MENETKPAADVDANENAGVDESNVVTEIDESASNENESSGQPATAVSTVDESNRPQDVEVVLTNQQQTQFEEKSSEFIGQWNRLNSTTNWNKGKIILEWRDNLGDSDLPEASYTDERWSQIVGGVTPQHVGRLRRTFSRFGHVFTQYEGLFWSHFYAALEWDDSEMWLEGAVQNKWSVSAMRRERWETLGKNPSEKPQVTDIVVTEADEEMKALAAAGRAVSSDGEVIEGPIYEGPDFGDEPNPSSSGASSKDTENSDSTNDLDSVKSEATGPKVRPFESFTELPKDISVAINSLKVAIITHKAKEWGEIPLDDVLGVLDALKQLATAAPE